MEVIPIDLNAHIEPAYMLLVVAVSYAMRDILAAQIKGNKRIAVLIIATLIGVPYYYYVGVSIINLIVSYSLVTTCYDLILKKITTWLKQNSQANQ
jgi:hypothetical protein